MKECLSCHSKAVEELAHTCPRCGGQAFIMGVSIGGLSGAMDAMKKQELAAQHVNRSHEFFTNGQYPEAEAELKKAIEVNPMNSMAHGNMGYMLVAQGRHADAIPWFEKALQLNPKHPTALDALQQARAAAPQKSGNSITRDHTNTAAPRAPDLGTTSASEPSQRTYRAKCPGCSAMFKVQEAWLGRKATCKACGTKFTIPLPAPSSGQHDDIVKASRKPAAKACTAIFGPNSKGNAAVTVMFTQRGIGGTIAVADKASDLSQMPSLLLADDVLAPGGLLFNHHVNGKPCQVVKDTADNWTTTFDNHFVRLLNQPTSLVQGLDLEFKGKWNICVADGAATIQYQWPSIQAKVLWWIAQQLEDTYEHCRRTATSGSTLQGNPPSLETGLSHGGIVPLPGGEGMTPDTPVIIDCANMAAAEILIDKFISEKHGVKGRGWEKTYFDFLARDGKYRFTKRILVGLLPDHSSVTYYFDLSRPMNAMKRLFNLG